MPELWKLNENLEVIHVDNYSEVSWLTLLIPVGSKQDQQYKGLAHMVEHVLIHSARIGGMYPYSISGLTEFDKTLYRIRCFNNTLVESAIKALVDLWTGTYLSSKYIMIAKKEIILEIIENNPLRLATKWLLLKNGLFEYPPRGKIKDVIRIGYQEILSFHQRFYVCNKCKIIWCGPRCDNVISFLEKISMAHCQEFLEKKMFIPPSFSEGVYFYRESNESIGIYTHSCYTMDVINNISKEIVYMFLPLFFKDIYNINCKDFIVGMRLYDRSHMYFCIETLMDIKKNQIKKIGPAFPKQLYIYIEKRLTDFILQDIIQKEVEELANIEGLPNSDITENAVFALLYNSPFYSYTLYKNAYLTIRKENVLTNLNFWLNRNNVFDLSSISKE